MSGLSCARITQTCSEAADQNWLRNFAVPADKKPCSAWSRLCYGAGMLNSPEVPHSGPPRKSRAWFAAGGTAAVSIVIWSLVFHTQPPPVDESGGQTTQHPDGQATDLHVPKRSTSPFLNTRPGVKYVGSTVCQDCHAEAHRTFALTAHSRSLTLVHADSHPADGVVDHSLSGRSYHVSRAAADDKTVLHGESVLHNGQRTEIVARPVKYQLGSGHVAFSYLAEDDGFLVQSPVTWFARRQRWDMSPGYDTADHPSFSRVIRSGCLYCHTGHMADPDEFGLRHKITETSIGCERCHGPGELHVNLHVDDIEPPADIDRTIVNPVHLSRELSESVCAQCHLNGDVQSTVRGRSPHDFRPGLPLHEYRLEFRGAQSKADMRVAGHVEQLHGSLCYQKSGSLTCVTCHQPHEDRGPGERLAQHRSTCINCHMQQPCLVPVAKRETANADNCLACHMPGSPTEVTHVALTHHRIGIHNDPVPAPDTESDTITEQLLPLQSLVHLSNPDQDRSLGLAHLADVRMAGKSPEQMPRLQYAAVLLRQAWDNGIRDPETLTALAGIARDAGRIPMGIELAEQALQSPDLTATNRLVTIDVLAELHFRSGRMDRAAEYLRQLTQGHRSSLHWFLLAQAEGRQQHHSEAVLALRKAVELAPENGTYHAALAAVLEQDGATKEAEHHRKMASLLGPN